MYYDFIIDFEREQRKQITDIKRHCGTLQWMRRFWNNALFNWFESSIPFHHLFAMQLNSELRSFSQLWKIHRGNCCWVTIIFRRICLTIFQLCTNFVDLYKIVNRRFSNKTTKWGVSIATVINAPKQFDALNAVYAIRIFKITIFGENIGDVSVFRHNKEISSVCFFWSLEKFAVTSIFIFIYSLIMRFQIMRAAAKFSKILKKHNNKEFAHYAEENLHDHFWSTNCQIFFLNIDHFELQRASSKTLQSAHCKALLLTIMTAHSDSTHQTASINSLQLRLTEKRN